jgi:hypothetical protein
VTYPRTERRDVSPQDSPAQARSGERMRLAFWAAADKRAITTGPGWLWHGPCNGPVRDSDLPEVVAAKLAARRRRVSADAVLSAAVSPRSILLAPMVNGRTVRRLWVAGLAAAAAAELVARAGTQELHADWIAAGVIVAAVVATALWGWVRRDPLRLDKADQRAIAAVTRTLVWNPMAGAGKVSAGGSFVLEAIDVHARLAAHPAWQIPAMAALHARFDPDEEIFQIALAGERLDRLDAFLADGAGGDGVDGAVYREERDELATALLARLVAARSCIDSLDELAHRAEVLGRHPDIALADHGFGSVVESQWATETLAELHDALTAMASAYPTDGSTRTNGSVRHG